jgi:DNA polymerase III epsilon subunit-like protein
MKKKYISVDIEASGQYPWNSSMLSFGACVVDGKFDKTFYAELKPITDEYILENFKIGTSSLDCLEGQIFSPENALKILYEKGGDSKIIMPQFSNWILERTKGYRPVLVADNNLFDGMFIAYYFSKCNNNVNPFGYSSDSINSVFRSASRNMNENIKNIKLSPNEFPKHNALEDAIEQGIKFYNSLKHLGHKF